MEEVLNDRIFKSKVDYWIPLIISLAFIPTIVFSIIEQQYLVLVISTLFYSFIMISIFNIKYINRSSGVVAKVRCPSLDQIDMSALPSRHSDRCFQRMRLMTAYGTAIFSMSDVNRLTIEVSILR